MAGGIDWFRWHHGSVTDPKFQLVAKKAACRLSDVLAVWAFLLEQASAADKRGAYGDVDVEAVDCLFGFDDGTTSAILTHMNGRGLIAGGEIISWEKRQPKREREGDSSAERTRAYRERQRQQGDTTEETVTPCDASDDQETPRGEERREELKPTTPDGVVVGSVAARPACPHQEIIALYHASLPMGTQVRVWTGTREKHLQARWREDAKRQTIEWWRRFFAYCAKSEFLTGRAAPARDRDPFVVSLDWLVSPQNFAKVLEGKYHREAA